MIDDTPAYETWTSGSVEQEIVEMTAVEADDPEVNDLGSVRGFCTALPS